MYAYTIKCIHYCDNKLQQPDRQPDYCNDVKKKERKRLQ